MKPMLSTKELIEHMKEKGITFRETSEKEAMDFLENNNYYMKLAAYRANYEKCAEGKRKGMYQNLILHICRSCLDWICTCGIWCWKCVWTLNMQSKFGLWTLQQRTRRKMDMISSAAFLQKKAG